MMIGKKFGHLTVIAQDIKDSRARGKQYTNRWICQCVCGNKISRCASTLQDYASCGCRKEKRQNEITIDGDIAYLRIYHYDGDSLAIIDKEDAERVSRYKWRWSQPGAKNKQIIFRDKITKKVTSLGQFILNNIDNNDNNKTVHIDGNNLNFRKNNIKQGNKIIQKGNIVYMEMFCKGKKIYAAFDVNDIPLINEYRWDISLDSSNIPRIYGRKKDGSSTKHISLAKILITNSLPTDEYSQGDCDESTRK